ncbi:hypothetical protein Gogos_015111 [Gossypium gossypioides]|uniref:Uncharacterized protein n=1 Tax=Gossypium gossypioides TaxID=34282 RepID=A0A7J9C0S6_GOSGO|nr:hypothetical protein [Gossypium gossypioides]
MNIIGMGEQWVVARIKQKGYSKCIPWKTLGHIDDAVLDLFDQLDKKVTPVSVILPKTFISLSAFRRADEGRFIGCAQLLLAWFPSHF